jgi:copper chaperone
MEKTVGETDRPNPSRSSLEIPGTGRNRSGGGILEEGCEVMEKLKLSVQGMSCAHCVHAVKSAVGALKGVSSVEVSLEQKTVTVELDPAFVGLPAIKTAIEEEGYAVV